MDNLSRWTGDTLSFGLGISCRAAEERYRRKIGSDGKHRRVLAPGQTRRIKREPVLEWYLTDFDLLKRAGIEEG